MTAGRNIDMLAVFRAAMLKSTGSTAVYAFAEGALVLVGKESYFLQLSERMAWYHPGNLMCLLGQVRKDPRQRDHRLQG